MSHTLDENPQQLHETANQEQVIHAFTLLRTRYEQTASFGCHRGGAIFWTLYQAGNSHTALSSQTTPNTPAQRPVIQPGCKNNQGYSCRAI